LTIEEGLPKVLQAADQVTKGRRLLVQGFEFFKELKLQLTTNLSLK
jgi:hypothetical protein